MINNLQSLRGIFAIFIFFHHYNYNNLKNLFPAGGDSGVTFFFVLSGFVLCQGYFNKLKNNQINISNFYLKRFIRIYPLNLLCLIWALGLNRFRLSPDEYLPWLSDIILLQSWIPNSEFYFSGNAVAWCLSDMMFFYFSFPFLIKMLSSNGQAFTKVVISICIIWTICSPMVPEHLYNAIIYINPITRLIDFSIGICLWHIISTYRINRFTKVKLFNIKCSESLYEILTVLFFLIWLLVYQYIPECYALSSYWWLPVSLIIICFSISHNGVISKILQLKPLIWFGNISFTFYMIHVLGMYTGNILLRKLSIQDNFESNLILILFFDITMSFLIFSLFEKPIKNFFNKSIQAN